MSSIHAAVAPVIESVTNPQLQNALANSFERAAPALNKVEQAFESFTAQRPSPEAARTFMRSWHAGVLRRALFGPITPNFPGSLVQLHPNVRVTFTDIAAQLPPVSILQTPGQ